MKFNVNDKVRVKLTDRGREILFLAHVQRHEEMPTVFKDHHPPEEDTEGWSEWQLHSLMAELGPYVSMGVTLPFETEVELILPTDPPK